MCIHTITLLGIIKLIYISDEVLQDGWKEGSHNVVDISFVFWLIITLKYGYIAPNVP